MRVAAFDLSSKTGWAAWDGTSAAPTLGTKTLVGWGYDIGSMLEFWRVWLGDFFRIHRPELVGIEAWMLPEHGDGDTIRRQAALVGFTEWACKVGGARCELVHAASWRKTFLGSGRGKTAEFKARSIATCSALGWPIKDHNSAEAAGVLHHTATVLAGVSTPWRDPHLFYLGRPT